VSSNDGDSILSEFLNTKDSVTVNGRTIPIVNVSSPLEWGKLGLTIAGSVIAAVVLGIQRGIDAVLGVPVTLLNSASHWIGRTREVYRYPGEKREIWGDGLIETVESGLLGVIDAAWTPVTGLGWLSFPVAVGTMLVSLYLVVLAVNYATEEVW